MEEILFNGNCGGRICIARWSNERWKLQFFTSLMLDSKLWRSIRFHWNALIDTKTPDADFEFASEEGADGAERDEYSAHEGWGGRAR